jgi:hypothetical protein
LMLVADEELGRRASGCGALWKQRQTLGCDASRRRRKAPDYDASRSEEAIQVRATAVASRGAGSAPCSLVGVPSPPWIRLAHAQRTRRRPRLVSGGEPRRRISLSPVRDREGGGTEGASLPCDEEAEAVASGGHAPRRRQRTPLHGVGPASEIHRPQVVRLVCPRPLTLLVALDWWPLQWLETPSPE